MASSPTKTYHKTTYSSLDPGRLELSARGKTIVITGGGTGIGAETARYFAKASASRVAIIGRREEPLLETKAAIEEEIPGTEVITVPLDVTKTTEVEAAFEKIAAGRKIDVLCSNAAVMGTLGNIANLTPDEWLEGISINLRGNINVTTAYLKYKAKDGVIIETNSAAAHLDITSGFSTYNVSKMATARLFQCVQYEHPELSVFSIQPGAVNTAMVKQAGYKETKEGEENQWKGQGSDLLSSFDDASLPASFMVWLASPEARFLKGKFLWANWDVDELKARAKEIENAPFLSIGLQGWPFA